MAKLFRLAVALDAYVANPDKTVRPPKPPWLAAPCPPSGSARISWRYWTKIYWATPPWITPKMVEQMRRIYTRVPPGKHVDHIVPLSSPTVCGLHVPWNLQYLPDKANLAKSNHMWPGHPLENEEMWPDLEPHQLSLGI